MIFMLQSPVRGLTREMKRNFKHLVQQAKSKNHEICQDLLISYVEATVKIEKASHNLSCTMFKNQSILEDES